jgi:RNA polymerase sigma-70 factor (ECF subfamily)
MPDGIAPADAAWLEPYPDWELEGIADDAPNPEARYTTRQAVQLAFVAVIQQLPPRQRAVLLLCDVLGWSAAETASLVGGSIASVNSALQRSRGTLARHFPNGEAPAALAPTAAQQQLLGRYMQAWERLDLDGFVSLLREDATYTMPPQPQWYVGRAAIRAFFAWAWKLYGGFLMIPTAANRQAAFAAYSRTGTDGPWAAHSIHVLSAEPEGISRLTLFVKPDGPRLFGAFGLSLTLADAAAVDSLPKSRSQRDCQGLTAPAKRGPAQ